MGPVRSWRHDGDHQRPGRAAARMIRPLHGAPVDHVSAGRRPPLPRPQRRSGVLPGGGVGVEEVHGHATRIAFPVPAGQGPKAPSVRDQRARRDAALPERQACEAISLRRHCPGQVLGVAFEPLSLRRMPPEAPPVETATGFSARPADPVSVSPQPEPRTGAQGPGTRRPAGGMDLRGALRPWARGTCRHAMELDGGDLDSSVPKLTAGNDVGRPSDDQPSGSGKAAHHTRT